MASLFDRLKFLEPFSSKKIQDYEKEILSAQMNGLAILAETKRAGTGKELILIKEIEKFSKVNAISARFMYTELGEIIAITGKGHRYVEKPKIEQKPLELVADEFCLVFSKNNYPKIICHDYETLLETYKKLLKDF